MSASRHEYAAGHLPGAIHASRGMLEFKLSNSPELSSRDLKIVLYCKTSGRAALAACALPWVKSTSAVTKTRPVARISA